MLVIRFCRFCGLVVCGDGVVMLLCELSEGIGFGVGGRGEFIMRLL